MRHRSGLCRLRLGLALAAGLLQPSCGPGSRTEEPRLGYSDSSDLAVILDDATQPSAQYPSTQTVHGLSGGISFISVTLHLFHPYPADVDALLVGPGGQAVFLMSDCGDSMLVQAAITIVSGPGLQFAIPAAGPIVTGTYAPTNYNTPGDDDTFYAGPAPVAPPGPYPASFSSLLGTDPNGTWRLYIKDDEAPDSGVLFSWDLTIYTM